MSLISAISFVPQGHAAEFPTKYNLTEDEYERIQGLSALHLSSARSDLKNAQNGGEASADDDEEDTDLLNLPKRAQLIGKRRRSLKDDGPRKKVKVDDLYVPLSPFTMLLTTCFKITVPAQIC